MTEARSFPEAADGLPQAPMEAELWAAGCDLETARFVAKQLDREGYRLIKPHDLWANAQDKLGKAVGAIEGLERYDMDEGYHIGPVKNGDFIYRDEVLAELKRGRDD